MSTTQQSHPASSADTATAATLRTAVIILNWNGEALMREFLPQVLAATPPELARVVVADNGSDDGSLAMLRSEFPQVEILVLGSNFGFAGGYNRAIAQYRDFPYAVLLNSDAAPRQGWIEALTAFMDAHPNAGACQPKILSYKDKGRFEYAGAAGGYIDRNGFPYCRGRVFDSVELDHGQHDAPQAAFWATGAALMVRPQAYFEAGGLDERFFAHMEEIDLCWRMWLGGWEVYAVPQAAVEHLGGASLPASNPRKTYLNFRNNLLMMHKNLPDTSRRSHLLRRMMLDGVAWVKFAITGHFAQAGAIWRAHRDFRKLAPLYTSHPSRDLIAEFPNILIDHYLRRPIRCQAPSIETK